MSKFFSRLPVIINTRLSIVVVVVFMVLVVVVVVVLVNVNFVVSVVVVVDFPELCMKRSIEPRWPIEEAKMKMMMSWSDAVAEATT